MEQQTLRLSPRPRRGLAPGLLLCVAGLALELAAGLPLARAQTTAPAPGAPSPATVAFAPAGSPPVETFFARPAMRNPVLSPSGRHLAWLQSVPGKHNALVVMDLHNRKDVRGLVRHADADIVSLRWVDDEYLIYSVTDDENGTGPIYFAPGLFAIARAGGDPKGLIKTTRPFIVDGGQARNDRRLEPNHTLLSVPQDGSHEIIVGETGRGAGELRTVTPLRLNVETLRTRRMDLGDLPGEVNHWLFDLAGRPRVAVIERDGRFQVLWREAEGGAWKSLLDAERMRVPWRPFDLDEQGGLYVTRPEGKDGATVLSRLDFTTGRPERLPLVNVTGFDFRGTLLLEKPGGRTLGVRVLADAETTVWTDPAMKALQARIDESLPGRVNRLSCRDCERADATLFVESYSDRDPGHWLLWHADTGKFDLLGRPMPAVDPTGMASLDLHRITARDGRSVPVWLTLPARAPGAPPPPAVVLVHGGPHVRGVSWRWNAMPQFLASRGYAVVEPEFRGSAGYGVVHERAGWKQWGQAMQDDIADALLWAAAQGHVDGSRACIMGASYGGYATLMGLVRHPDLYRCGVAAMAVTDLTRFVEGSWWWQDDIAGEYRRYDIPSRVGDPKADAEMLRANSPRLQAVRIKAPVLLAHGQLDRRVPIVHATDMRSALKDAGNEPEWLVFGDEGHGWGRLENRITYAKRVEQFLGRHLQPAVAAAAPPQQDPGGPREQGTR